MRDRDATPRGACGAASTPRGVEGLDGLRDCAARGRRATSSQCWRSGWESLPPSADCSSSSTRLLRPPCVLDPGLRACMVAIAAAAAFSPASASSGSRRAGAGRGGRSGDAAVFASPSAGWRLQAGSARRSARRARRPRPARRELSSSTHSLCVTMPAVRRTWPSSRLERNSGDRPAGAAASAQWHKRRLLPSEIAPDLVRNSAALREHALGLGRELRKQVVFLLPAGSEPARGRSPGG